MDKIKEEALRMAATFSKSNDPDDIVKMAERFARFLRGDAEALPVQNSKIVGPVIAAAPETFQRITDTAGNTYDKHKVPPFMVPPLTADQSMTAKDLYDDAKMAERKATGHPTNDAGDY